MALSEAKKAADKRYTAKLDNIMVRPYREEGSTIRAAAAAAGMSVQAYVLQAVRAWMEREQAESAAPLTAGPERTEAGSMPVPGDGPDICAGNPEKRERLSGTPEGGASRSCRDAGEAAGDWTVRLSRSPNRSRTMEVIKRITETARNDDKCDK